MYVFQLFQYNEIVGTALLYGLMIQYMYILNDNYILTVVAHFQI